MSVRTTEYALRGLGRDVISRWILATRYVFLARIDVGCVHCSRSGDGRDSVGMNGSGDG